LVVLDTLTPAERVAFVMHDVFAAPFDEIAAIVGRSPAATRQLASRARRRVHGAPVILDDDAQRQRRVVEAFLRASRRGDFAALLALLDPGIVMTSDSTALDMGSPERLDGADDVATQFSGQARAARLTLLNGAVGLLWRVGDRPKVAFEFVTIQDRVAAINLRADHDFLDQLEWEPLDG
jgi:RNA polymerase sigma-70 factor (ECF subfamily)